MLCGPGRAKNRATHARLHTLGLLFKTERVRSHSHTQQGEGDEGKYRRAEGGRGGGDRGTSGIENEEDMM